MLTVFNVPPSQRKTSFQRLCVYIRYCALRSAENTDCGCRPDSSIRLLSENRLRCYISAPTISKVSAVSTSHQSLRTLFCLQCRDFKEDIQISEALGCTLSALLRRATSSDVNIQVRFRLCNLRERLVRPRGQRLEGSLHVLGGRARCGARGRTFMHLRCG